MHPIYENRALDTEAGEIRLLTLLPPDDDNPDGIIECQLGVYSFANICTHYIEFETTAGEEDGPPEAASEPAPKHRVRNCMKRLLKGKDDPQNTTTHNQELVHYVALSYAWGDDPNEKNPDRWLERTKRDEQKILINGHVFRVRRNLHAALLQFRTMTRFKQGLMIWIDAITINQDDEVEKNAQIAIMHQIYQRAGNVVVWIGPQSEMEFDNWGKGKKCLDCSKAITEEKWDVVRTIRIFEGISQYYPTEHFGDKDDSQDLVAAHQYREGAAFRLRNALHQWKELMLENPDFFLDEGYAHMWMFFEREYWRRLWIIQELAMGNARMPVICGDYVTHWYHIRNAAILLHSAMDVVGELTTISRGVPDTVNSTSHTASHVAGIAQLELLSHRKELPEIDKSLLSFTSTPGIGGGQAIRGSLLDQTLALAMQANCKMDKDRIRGMLHVYGMPRGFAVKGILDFDTWSTAEIFQEFSRLLLTLGRFEILALLDGCNADTSPASWVPDFARPASRRTNPIHGPWFADGVIRNDPSDNPFFAIPRMLPNWIEVEAGKGRNALVLKGVTLIDEIDGVGAMQPALTKRIASKSSTFKTGVVQPSKPKIRTNPLYEKDHVVQQCIYRTLTGSTDSGGIQQDFKRLLSCFSPNAPDETDPHFWNWDFFNASADLKFHGKPLRDWMEPYQERVKLTHVVNDAERKDWCSVSAAMGAMKSKVRGRRLFVTADRGFLGLGPMIIQPGNVLATVFGFPRPIILMRAGNRQFRILGECYVDDIMEGEAQKEAFGVPDCDIGSILVI